MYFLSFTGLTDLKIFGRHWESNPGGPACITNKHSATELLQPADKQTLQFCIYTVKGYCYATISLSTDQRKFSLFQRFLLFVEFFLLT